MMLYTSEPSVSAINDQDCRDGWTSEIKHNTEQSRPLIVKTDNPNMHSTIPQSVSDYALLWCLLASLADAFGARGGK